VVIAQWDGALDAERARSTLNGEGGGDDEPLPDTAVPEQALVAATYVRSRRP